QLLRVEKGGCSGWCMRFHTPLRLRATTAALPMQWQHAWRNAPVVRQLVRPLVRQQQLRYRAKKQMAVGLCIKVPLRNFDRMVATMMCRKHPPQGHCGADSGPTARLFWPIRKRIDRAIYPLSFGSGNRSVKSRRGQEALEPWRNYVKSAISLRKKSSS